MSDRTVHAVCGDGREVVRYDKAGKWWLEGEQRRPLSLQGAVEIATIAPKMGGRVFFGRSGGTTFDKRVRAALAPAPTPDDAEGKG